MANNRTKWPGCLHPQQQTTSIHHPSQSGLSQCPGWTGWYNSLFRAQSKQGVATPYTITSYKYTFVVGHSGCMIAAAALGYMLINKKQKRLIIKRTKWPFNCYSSDEPWLGSSKVQHLCCLTDVCAFSCYYCPFNKVLTSKGGLKKCFHCSPRVFTLEEFQEGARMNVAEVAFQPHANWLPFQKVNSLTCILSLHFFRTMS